MDAIDEDDMDSSWATDLVVLPDTDVHIGMWQLKLMLYVLICHVMKIYPTEGYDIGLGKGIKPFLFSYVGKK